MTEIDKVAKEYEANFKQWQKVGESIQKIIAPQLKQQELIQKVMQPFVDSGKVLQKVMQPIIESEKAFQKALEPILAEQERLNSIVRSIKIPQIVLPDLSPWTKQAEEFIKSMAGFISPAFEQLQRSFQELPPRTQEAMILLGTHGWYFDLRMPITALWQLKKAITEGNVKDAEDALIEYFENKLDETEKSIVKRFPNRGKIIQAAFNAHRRKEYELSVPVFLSQTDGICKEVINAHLFRRKRNNKPRTASYVEQITTDTYRAALLSPLAQILPIAASENERGESFFELNRHMVLHGDSLDYGTKINSLKAISLLNYVAHVLRESTDNS